MQSESHASCFAYIACISSLLAMYTCYLLLNCKHCRTAQENGILKYDNSTINGMLKKANVVETCNNKLKLGQFLLYVYSAQSSIWWC